VLGPVHRCSLAVGSLHLLQNGESASIPFPSRPKATCALAFPTTKGSGISPESWEEFTLRFFLFACPEHRAAFSSRKGNTQVETIYSVPLVFTAMQNSTSDSFCVFVLRFNQKPFLVSCQSIPWQAPRVQHQPSPSVPPLLPDCLDNQG
jgi:hypothetical protein